MFEAIVEPSEQINEITGAVIGAAIEVHRHLGPGYLEAFYERALMHELKLRNRIVQCQVAVDVPYKGISAGTGLIDLVVDQLVVVELKATERLIEVHRAQVSSYLKAAGLQVGLLINFNVATLRDGIRRVVRTPA